jgi:hypothetical protein
MNNITREVLKAMFASLLRWALASVFAVLFREGIVTEGQASFVVIGIAGGLVTLGWGLYQKYRVRLLNLLALKLPEDATPELLDYAKANGIDAARSLYRQEKAWEALPGAVRERLDRGRLD